MKKKIISLTEEEKKIHWEQKVCYICKKGFSTDDNKRFYIVKDHCHYAGKYRGATNDICNLRYKTPKEISVVFHNGSTYDYHFIIEERAKEFEGQFVCLRENTENILLFQYQLKKNLTMVNQLHTK